MRVVSAGLARLFGALLTVALLVAGFVFSIVLVLVAVGVGAVALSYFWWKTRALRRAIREQRRSAGERPAHAEDAFLVIEGEARVVDERPEAGAGRRGDGAERLPH